MQEDPNKVTFFAKTNSRGEEIPFGIKRKDRARHMYVIGKTGMGKSTLLENMAIQDIRNGEGMAFIDPHGSTADRIMEYVPEHRIKDVLYFAPFDMDYPVAFNVMEDVGYDKRHLVVSGLLSAFRKIWVDAWSARMEYILSNTLLALLEYEGATLLDVNRMLVNKSFRKKVVDNIKDPVVRAFWVEEFAVYTDRYTQEATPAIQNKIGQFTSNPLIRNIVGQPKSSFDLREMMDQKKIIIINLSKGRVGEVNATLLGSMIVTKIYLAAMSRADVTATTLATLPSFYFYVDEFQSFANESFADILSEARKYKLNLLIAHQYIEQMEEEVRDAVFGNVGTTVAFRVGPFDAEVLETIFQPQFTQTDLVNLGFAQIYLTLMIDGVGSPPFSATTLSPFDPPPQKFIERVIQSSRTQYAAPRAQIEAALVKWQESDPVVAEAPKPKRDYSSNRASSSSSFSPRPSTPSAPNRPSQPVSDERPAAPVPQPPPHRTPEVREAEAKIVGAAIAQEHAMATSKAMNEEQPMPPPPKPEHREQHARSAHRERPHTEHRDHKPKPSAPTLEGSKSLREALQAVTGERAPGPRIHAPDLKATIHNVAPRASDPAPQKKSEPAELPEGELRALLAVDEIDEEHTS
ncbi:MAG: type IV secretion system DNA-binding domain-containing protein [Candidatus Pacebacteria bacterium]|nr:type IV secretion system DNA-binding domain-containing protein [Candidatus Paceibacterota bacterium]